MPIQEQLVFLFLPVKRLMTLDDCWEYSDSNDMWVWGEMIQRSPDLRYIKMASLWEQILELPSLFKTSCSKLCTSRTWENDPMVMRVMWNTEERANENPTHLSESVQFNSVQSLSHVWLFATPWIAAHQAFPSITNSWSLLRLMSIESVMPSNHPTLCHLLLLQLSIFSSIRVFSSESVLHIRCPKYWCFSFSISPANEYSGLISFRMKELNFLGLTCSPRDSQESFPAPQFKSINSSALSSLYSLTLTPYMTTGKNHSFD